MTHIKDDFTYHKIFDNKYVEQSYIGYLTRGKKYLMRLDSWRDTESHMNYHVIKPIDFIIRCNNAIGSRKPKSYNIEEIKNLYSKPIYEYAYYYISSKKTIDQYNWNLS